jgi:hypothetical protein
MSKSGSPCSRTVRLLPFSLPALARVWLLVTPLVALAPMATFPTPAKQATLALQFLFDAGARPENPHVAGEGNHVLPVLSNMLHPHEDLPQIRPTGRLRSLGLFSPWVLFTAETKFFHEFNGIDFLDRWILEPTVRSCSSAIPKPTARSQSDGGLV